jgi:hypothetical protein
MTVPLTSRLVAARFFLTIFIVQFIDKTQKSLGRVRSVDIFHWFVTVQKKHNTKPLS